MPENFDDYFHDFLKDFYPTVRHISPSLKL